MTKLVLSTTIFVLACVFAYVAQAQTPCVVGINHQGAKLDGSFDSRGRVLNSYNLYHRGTSAECAPNSNTHDQAGAVRTATETLATAIRYWHDATTVKSSQNSTQETRDQKLRKTATPQSSKGPDNRYCGKGNVPKFGSNDGPAELPRTCLYTAREATPSPGTIIPVNKGESISDAIARASCGDIIELQAGGTYTGLTPIPAKPCDDQHWITVRTSGWRGLPPEGTRVTPCYGGVPSLRGRPAYSCSHAENVMAKVLVATMEEDTRSLKSMLKAWLTQSKHGQIAPIYFLPEANHYRFIGIELTREAGMGTVSLLADLNTANKIIFDQVWMHGVDAATYSEETTVGVYLHLANSVAVIDSYFNDFYCLAGSTGSCTDAKTIGGGIGTPSGAWATYKIVNNYLEASGQNFFEGGGPGTTAPADFEIRRNHMFKPLFWNQNDPSYDGGVRGIPIIVKNILELKNATRVLIEGNVLENSWGGFSQNGPGLVLKATNQSNTCPGCFVTNVTVRYNIIRRTGVPIVLLSGRDVPCTGNCWHSGNNSFSIHDIIADHIEWGSGCYGNTCSPYFNYIYTAESANATQTMHDITYNHITEVLDNQPGTSMFALGGPTAASGRQMYNLTLKNSIMPAGEYGIGGGPPPNDCGFGRAASTPYLAACFGGTLVFGNNMIPWGTHNGGTWASLGGALKLVADQNAVRYVNLSAGDYHLQNSSPGHNAADDGTDIGADVDAVNTYTQGVQ